MVFTAALFKFPFVSLIMRRLYNRSAMRLVGLLVAVLTLFSAAGCHLDGTSRQTLWKLPGNGFDGVPPQFEPALDEVYSSGLQE